MVAKKPSIGQYEFVSCRASGHSWDQIPTTRRPQWGTLLTFRCVDCGSVREDIIDSNYNLSSRAYVKPEGYEWGETTTRGDWRRALVARDRGMVKRGKKLVKVEGEDAEA